MDHRPFHRYSPQTSCSIGASCTVAGSSAVTSRSTAQSEHTMISPASVPSSRVISAAHSGQVTVDILFSLWIPRSLRSTPWGQTLDLIFFQRLESSDISNLIFNGLKARASNRISLLNRSQRVEDLDHILFKWTEI